MNSELKSAVVDAAVQSVSPFGLLSHRESSARELSLQILETLGALGFIQGQLRTALTPQSAVHGYYQDSDISDMDGVLQASRTVAHDLAMSGIGSNFATSIITRSMAATNIANAVLACIVTSGALASSNK